MKQVYCFKSGLLLKIDSQNVQTLQLNLIGNNIQNYSRGQAKESWVWIDRVS